MSLGSEFDIVLGNSYFRKRRVIMDLQGNCMQLTKGNRVYLTEGKICPLSCCLAALAMKASGFERDWHLCCWSCQEACLPVDLDTHM